MPRARPGLITTPEYGSITTPEYGSSRSRRSAPGEYIGKGTETARTDEKRPQTGSVKFERRGERKKVQEEAVDLGQSTD